MYVKVHGYLFVPFDGDDVAVRALIRTIRSCLLARFYISGLRFLVAEEH